MKEIILATSNKHKLQEISYIMRKLPFRLLSLLDIGLRLPEENGNTFFDNALQKAKYTADHVDLPVLADDSGLIVKELNGEPGIRSGRYAGTNATDEDNRNKLKLALQQKGIIKSKAKYYCCVVFINPQDKRAPIMCSGSWNGEIRDTCNGYNGFGYDPMFYIPRLKCTVAELSLEDKSKLSHRYKAINEMSQYLQGSFIL